MEPEGGVEIIAVIPGQLSDANGSKDTKEDQEVWAFVTMISGGQVIVGEVLSTTITSAEHELEAPLLSETESRTVFVPRGYGPGGS